MEILRPGDLAEGGDVAQIDEVAEDVAGHELIASPRIHLLARFHHHVAGGEAGHQGVVGRGQRHPLHLEATDGMLETDQLVKVGQPLGRQPAKHHVSAALGEGPQQVAFLDQGSQRCGCGLGDDDFVLAVGQRGPRVALQVVFQARSRKSAGPGAGHRVPVVGLGHQGRLLAADLVVGRVVERVVEEPLGHGIKGQLFADHQLAQDHQAVVHLALGHGRAGQFRLALHQRAAAFGRLLVDVAIDDVVLRPSEEILLAEAGEHGMLQVFGERNPADIIGRF